MRFEIDKNSKGQWIWRLKAQNGRVIADSAESYANKSDCENGIKLVKDTNSGTPVDDVSAKASGSLSRS